MKFHGNTAVPIVYVVTVTAFTLQWQIGVVETEEVLPSKMKVFTIWPFTKKHSNSWEEIGYREPSKGGEQGVWDRGSLKL